MSNKDQRIPGQGQPHTPADNQNRDKTRQDQGGHGQNKGGKFDPSKTGHNPQERK